MTALSDYLRQQLSGSGKLEIVNLPCQSAQCTATDPGFEKLSEQAKQAGARFLIIGIVKKTSTLIGWIEYSVLGVNDQRAICGELVSYRDDTDEFMASCRAVFGRPDTQSLHVRCFGAVTELMAPPWPLRIRSHRARRSRQPRSSTATQELRSFVARCA